MIEAGQPCADLPEPFPVHPAASPMPVPPPFRKILVVGEQPLAAVLARKLTNAALPVHHSPAIPETVSDCDLIIEAVAGSTAERSEALHRIEHETGSATLLVSLVGIDPLAALGRSLHDRKRHLGLSLPAPDLATDFAEIIGQDTRPDAADAIRALLAEAGIQSIQVTDAPGGHAGGLARAFANEGLALLGEGVPAATIERIALEAGMLIGPLAMMDAISLSEADRLLHAHDHDHDHDHSELTVEYQYNCTQPQQLKQVQLPLLQNYPGIEKLEVRMLSPAGQHLQSLGGQEHRLTLP